MFYLRDVPDFDKVARFVQDIRTDKILFPIVNDVHRMQYLAHKIGSHIELEFNGINKR